MDKKCEDCEHCHITLISGIHWTRCSKKIIINPRTRKGKYMGLCITLRGLIGPHVCGAKAKWFEPRVTGKLKFKIYKKYEGLISTIIAIPWIIVLILYILKFFNIIH